MGKGQRGEEGKGKGKRGDRREGYRTRNRRIKWVEKGGVLGALARR